MDRLNAMAIFVAVADQGSFTGAASQLGLSKAQVSKQIQALEHHVGVRLLNRTTRRLHLTELGQRYVEDCRRILAEIDATEALLSEGMARPRGLVRLTLPATLAEMHLVQHFPRLLTYYPDIRLDLDMNDRLRNLVESGFDLALRVGHPEDSSLIAKTLATTARVIVASPAYLAAHGTPTHPDQLAQHAVVNFSFLERAREWRLRDPSSGEDLIPRLAPGRFRANNGPALLAAVRQGAGILCVPDFIAAPAIAAGEVVCILREYCPPPVPVQVLYPPGRMLTAAQRVVLEFLTELLRPVPWSLPVMEEPGKPQQS